MSARLLKKTGQFLVFLWAIGTLTFFLARSVPGDPALAILNRPHSEDIRRLRQSLGLGRPLLEQYADYLQRLIRLDFGTSLVDGRSVRETIMTYLPNTLLLAAAAMTFAVPLALLLGFKSVCGRGRLWKAAATLFSAIGLAVPVFLTGICLILLFAVGLRFFPVSGGGGIDFLVLPALTLALPLGAQLIRMARTSLLAESERPYVLLARAKGLSQTQIYRRHILRNALPPVITLIGLQTGAVLGGAVIVENVFSWPGIGTLMLTAVRQRDYPMIQGTVMLVALLYLFVNHLVDIVYPLLDPRLDNDSIR